jgi:hypothetical protein
MKKILLIFCSTGNTIAFSPTSTLPLTLLGFTAERVDGSVQLVWKTASESNLS